jgi:hypothetical protein
MRVESFADDLNARRGIVSGRVALLPRSTEIQPTVATIRFFTPQGQYVGGQIRPSKHEHFGKKNAKSTTQIFA